MEQIVTFIKDYTAIVVACLAASVSIVNLFWSTRLNEGRDRRKTLWEHERVRFSELEDMAGRLVEDLLTFNIRSDEDQATANEKIKALRASTGRFLRYPEISEALREITHSTGWYLSRDMKHESKAEYEDARNQVNNSFKKLVSAIDATLKNAPKRL